MARIAVLVGAIALLCGCASQRLPVHCPAQRGYIYDQVGTGAAVVFNLERRNLSVQSKQAADVERISEFGGSFTNCSSDEIHCLSGIVDLIIPKNGSSGSWRSATADCRVERSVSQLIGECRGLQGNRITTFAYSAANGITTYSNFGPGYSTTYRIRGFCGLFAKTY